MSRELPLWNEAETEPQSQFQATFGHVIVAGAITPTWIDKTLSLQVVEMIAGDVISSPGVDSAGWWTFRGSPECMLVLSTDTFSVLYADSAHFMRSDRWIACSRGIKTDLCFGSQTDESVYTYLVFRRGVLVATRIREGDVLRLPPATIVSASFGGKVVAVVRDLPGQVGDDFESWIRQTPLPQSEGSKGGSFLPRTVPVSAIQIYQVRPKAKRWFGWQLV